MQIKEMFAGIRVLELASVLAGPSVGQFFAELGAEVIKVENPKTRGDVTRTWKLEGEATNDISSYFSCVNWGKKSISLDISHKEGLQVLKKLVQQSEIVISSYKPGDAQKLGVDYESLRVVKKQLIVGEITGYGFDNPKVGYDAVIQAEAGFMYINGELGSAPLKLPVALMDILAGHHLKEAILLAYIHRLKTGEGSHVSVSLIEAAISSLANQATNWLVANKEPKSRGSVHPNIAPYGDIFSTKEDDYIILAVGNDHQFGQLCTFLKRKDLPSDSRFRNNKARVKHRFELHDILKKAFSNYSTESIIKELTQVKVPVGQVKSVSETLQSKDAEALLIHSKELTGVRTFAAKLRNEGNSPHFAPPPHYGQHTIEMFKGVIGLKDEEIAYLSSHSII